MMIVMVEDGAKNINHVYGLKMMMMLMMLLFIECHIIVLSHLYISTSSSVFRMVTLPSIKLLEMANSKW